MREREKSGCQNIHSPSGRMNECERQTDRQMAGKTALLDKKKRKKESKRATEKVT